MIDQPKTLEAPIYEKPKRRIQTQKLAWLVLSSSFVVFCLLCSASTFGVYYFLFQSAVPMQTRVQVSQGSVGVVRTDLSESFELEGRMLSRGDQVLTDSQSQAVMSLRDATTDSLVALVTLRNDSQFVVRDTQQPRFEWGSRGYRIQFAALSGEFNVFIASHVDQQIKMSVMLPFDTLVDISEPGHYHLTVTDGEVQLETRRGQAAIITLNTQDSRSLTGGQRGVYRAETQELTVVDGYEELIRNDFFTEPPEAAFGNQSMQVPLIETWNCGDRTSDIPKGSFERVFFDGQFAVRLLRGANARSHGETLCIHPFGPSGQIGRRVDQYDQLILRTTFYIAGHSLDVCGVQGSECPVMLLMDYVDMVGRSNQWFHGFYANHHPSIEYPRSCVSCQQEHRLVKAGVWHTFESANLFTLLSPDSPDRRPASILNVRFYASGHEYDVYISELSLLASPQMAVSEDAQAETARAN